MGVLLEAHRTRVFKSKETGLVALCREVSEFAESRYAKDVDLSSARFEEDETAIYITFDNVK